MLTDVNMNEVINATQEKVFDGPSLFSNNVRTSKNLAMIALTTAGTSMGSIGLYGDLQRRKLTVQ
jgi:hypothetical protein